MLEWVLVIATLLGGAAALIFFSDRQRLSSSATVGDDPGPIIPVASPSPIYGNPPMPSQQFVGREDELRNLENYLLVDDSNVRITASVEGLAGIGKTELAAQLVHRLSATGRFRGGIYWFDAENPDLTPTWGGRIADDLCLPEGPLAERANVARATLAEPAEPVLLVLDNVTGWANDERPGPLAEGPHVRLLVTTRQRDLGGAAFEHFDTDLLDEDDARELLVAISGRQFDDQTELDDLLNHLAGHALSLEIAGATLREFPDMTPQDLLQTVHEDANWGSDVVDRVGYQATVGAAFRSLWDRLDEDTRDAWRLAACFEPQSVGIELSDCAGLDRARRSKLSRFHLIRTAEDSRWTMHRATRAFVKSVSTVEENLAAQRAFSVGCIERSRKMDLATGFRIYSPDRSHFDQALRLAPEVLSATDERILQLINNSGLALQSLGEFSLSRDLCMRAVERASLNLGEDHPNVATCHSNLALALLELGDLKGAKKLLEQALESDLRNFDEDDPGVAVRRSNLASVLRDLGDFEGAKKLLEQALESDLRDFDEDHPNVATSRSNLAMVLQDLGDLEGAKKQARLALEICTGLPEGTHIRTRVTEAMQGLLDELR